MAKKPASRACSECECQKFRKDRGWVRELNRFTSTLNASRQEWESGQKAAVALPDPTHDSQIPCKTCKHPGASHTRDPSETLADYARQIAIVESERRRQYMEERARQEEQWARRPRWQKALLSWSWRDPLLKIGPIVFFNWALIVCAPVAVFAYHWASEHKGWSRVAAGRASRDHRRVRVAAYRERDSVCLCQSCRHSRWRCPRRDRVSGWGHPTLVGVRQGDHA